MCSKLTLRPDPKKLSQLLGLNLPTHLCHYRGVSADTKIDIPANTAFGDLSYLEDGVQPGSKSLTVMLNNDGRQFDLTLSSWGIQLPSWNFTPINARLETVHSKFVPMGAGPCVIPVSSFFESGYEIGSQDEDPMALAGMYSMFTGRPSFAVITAEADPELRSIHPRMPVILKPGKDIKSWLTDMKLIAETPKYTLRKAV